MTLSLRAQHRDMELHPPTSQHAAVPSVAVCVSPAAHPASSSSPPAAAARCRTVPCSWCRCVPCNQANHSTCLTWSKSTQHRMLLSLTVLCCQHKACLRCHRVGAGTYACCRHWSCVSRYVRLAPCKHYVMHARQPLADPASLCMHVHIPSPQHNTACPCRQC